MKVSSQISSFIVPRKTGRNLMVPRFFMAYPQFQKINYVKAYGNLFMEGLAQVSYLNISGMKSLQCKKSLGKQSPRP